MKAFAALYRELDSTTSSLAKQAALQGYLRTACPADAAWAVYFLAGGKPRQIVSTKLLKQLAQEAAGLPQWLFDESYEAVGDLAETIALLLSPPTHSHDLGLATWVEEHLLALRQATPEVLEDRLKFQWQQLAADERLVYFKLITGSFRVGISKLQVTNALANLAEIDAKRVAQRLMGYTHISKQPTATDYGLLIAPTSLAEQNQRTNGQPYPFFLAHPLNLAIEEFEAALGELQHWLVEWKWDGIRAQLIQRGGEVWLWSRGEELITERFPELVSMAKTLPSGSVLDGEIIVLPISEGSFPEVGKIQTFAQLQKRLGRKTVGSKLLQELPVALVAYDLLEWQGQDLRSFPQKERRILLEKLLEIAPHPNLKISPLLQASSWSQLTKQRENARLLGAEGMMLKSQHAQYGVGRTKEGGVWWKWKIDPLSLDAVLIYAQRGHGRRASLYTDYTFAVWNGPPEQADRTLIPFAKAYSGLTDAEIKKVDAIIRKTTIESFGPVRSVQPTLVFELGFEGISRSSRHKSGIAVRFPRILRWREDKSIHEADTLETLAALLPQVEKSPQP